MERKTEEKQKISTPKRIPTASIDAVINWFTEKLTSSEPSIGCIPIEKDNIHKVAIFCEKLRFLLEEHDFENPPEYASKHYDRDTQGWALVLSTKCDPMDGYLIKAAGEANLPTYSLPKHTHIYIWENGDVALWQYRESPKMTYIFDIDEYKNKQSAHKIEDKEVNKSPTSTSTDVKPCDHNKRKREDGDSNKSNQPQQKKVRHYDQPNSKVVDTLTKSPVFNSNLNKTKQVEDNSPPKEILHMPKKIPLVSINAVIGWFRDKMNKTAIRYNYNLRGCNEPKKVEQVVNAFCNKLKSLLEKHDFDNPGNTTRRFDRINKDCALVLSTKYEPMDPYLREAAQHAKLNRLLVPTHTYIYIWENGDVTLFNTIKSSPMTYIFDMDEYKNKQTTEASCVNYSNK